MLFESEYYFNSAASNHVRKEHYNGRDDKNFKNNKCNNQVKHFVMNFKN